MIAKPAVEPSARCALRIPDAMPDRSGGIAPIASLVAAATDRPAGGADEHERQQREPQQASRCPPRGVPVPMTRQPSPMSVGLRAPRAATIRPRERRQDDRRDRHRQHQEAGLLGAVRAHVLEVLRDDEQRPVDAEQRGEDGVDRRVVHAVAEHAHVHHRIARVQLVAHEHDRHDRGDDEACRGSAATPSRRGLPGSARRSAAPTPTMNSSWPGTSKPRLAGIARFGDVAQ